MVASAYFSREASQGSTCFQYFLGNTETVVQRCSVKKVFLEISQNSQENACARENTSATLLKKKFLTQKRLFLNTKMVCTLNSCLVTSSISRRFLPRDIEY